MKKLLLLCDDYYHHSDVVIQGLNYLNELYSVDIIEDAHEFNGDMLKEYSVVIFSKSNNYSSKDRDPWMLPDVEQAFLDYVKNGGALIVTHSGSAGYKDTPLFRELIGGVFVHHPEQCNVKVELIKASPITNGIATFEIFDEHYHMDINLEDIDIIMNTVSHAGTQPGAWTREVGKGKVFVFTPGHNLPVWLNKNCQNIMLNAINWCMIH